MVDVLCCYGDVLWVWLVVLGEMVNDIMILYCEVGDLEDLVIDVNVLVGSLCEVIKLWGEVLLVVLGSLFNDGKVIEDVWKYE